MSKEKPWMPSGEHVLQAIEAIAQPAREAGFEVIPQLFAMFPMLDQEGCEQAISGRLRYSIAKVLDDWRALPRPGTICFVIRYCDPDTPDGRADIERHRIAAAQEGGK